MLSHMYVHSFHYLVSWILPDYPLFICQLWEEAMAESQETFWVCGHERRGERAAMDADITFSRRLQCTLSLSVSVFLQKRGLCKPVWDGRRGKVVVGGINGGERDAERMRRDNDMLVTMATHRSGKQSRRGVDMSSLHERVPLLSQNEANILFSAQFIISLVFLPLLIPLLPFVFLKMYSPTQWLPFTISIPHPCQRASAESHLPF